MQYASPCHLMVISGSQRSVLVLTFNSEVHGLADVCSHIIADLAEVVSTVFFQHMFNQQGTICEKLDTTVQCNWLELRNPGTYSRTNAKTDQLGKKWFHVSFFLYEIRKKLLPPVLRDTIQLQYKQFWYCWKKLIVSLPKLNSLNGMKKSFWNIRVTIFVHVKWNKKSRKQERKNQEGGERK